MNARQITAGVCGLVVAMLLGTLSPAARAHDARSIGAAAAPVDHAPAPELSAQWRVRFEPRGALLRTPAQEQVWRLHRGSERIVWSKGGGVDEVWLRGPSGLSFQRVMHPQRHVIDYTRGRAAHAGRREGLARPGHALFRA